MRTLQVHPVVRLLPHLCHPPVLHPCPSLGLLLVLESMLINRFLLLYLLGLRCPSATASTAEACYLKHYLHPFAAYSKGFITKSSIPAKQAHSVAMQSIHLLQPVQQFLRSKGLHFRDLVIVCSSSTLLAYHYSIDPMPFVTCLANSGIGDSVLNYELICSSLTLRCCSLSQYPAAACWKLVELPFLDSHLPCFCFVSMFVFSF